MSVPPTEVEERGVFVPAIMSVGLVFSFVTLLRDALGWLSWRARERRTAIEARTTFAELVAEEEPEPRELGILSRWEYLLTAIALLAGAAYVAIGSTANFLRDGGYVSDIAWLLALSLALSLLLGFLGGVAAVVYRSWPEPPAWTFGPLRTAPLTATPGRDGAGPPWSLSAGVVGAAVATLVITLMVATGTGAISQIDEPILDWLVETESLDRLRWIDPFGSTVFSIGLVILIGLSAIRCRVMALAYPLAFAASWNTTQFLRDVVDRSRPSGLGLATSFPSGHMVQAVFIAGLVPLALAVLVGDRRLVTLTRAVLGAAVLATAVHRIHRQNHWPSDALGGVLLGLTVVVAVHWLIGHRRWHARCGSCPWSAHPHKVDWSEGLFTLSPSAARVMGRLGVASAIGAAAVLSVATVVIGLPTDPEGEGLASALVEPVQLGFAAMVGIAGLVALRWRAPAAVLMMVAASILGVAASVQYEPYLAFSLALLLMLPAVLTWLAWQPHETLGSIARLATITVVLLSLTGFGTREVYDHYFGPTHPASAQEPLDSDAGWLWLGAVTDTTATVVAGDLPSGRTVALRWAPSGAPRDSAAEIRATVDRYGLARFELADLSPDTSYAYRIVDDPDDDVYEPDDVLVDFRTHETGAHDLVVVLGSCARRGSNGSVFDAMVAEDPDLFLALGDLHYGNIASTKPADHIREYGQSLRQPGQSALFRSVPTAYVWDDHDFGPNDSDSSSPARDAVAVAYRAAVPHAGVDPDPAASIGHAFTVGRVRFVMTDTRSHRTSDTILGEVQRRWLVDELVQSSRTHALVVWANPTPWISDAGSGADDWSGFADDRELLARALIEADVDNLVMVSGDAHMVAIDDGSNSGYGPDRVGGFPVLHAAALDRPGSVKGGPYSHGAFGGGGQYGRLEVDDDGGSEITVTLSGHTWDGKTLTTLTRTFEVGSAARE